MPGHIIVVEKRQDFRWEDPQGRVVTLESYLRSDPAGAGRYRKVINFCRDYSYLGAGYYCSLLAEARRDRVTPGLDDMLELARKELYEYRIDELDKLVEPMDAIPRSVGTFAIHSYFGRVEDEGFARLAARAFELFRCPLMEISLTRSDIGKDVGKDGEGWRISTIKPLDLRQVPAERDELFLNALEAYTHRPWRRARPARATVLDLAILYDPKDPMPPTNRATLDHFSSLAESMGIATHLIEKRDYARLTQFDALFIRETTSVPHHTFRFAKRAERAGMPVIDDPGSILRCTNKVYLHELLNSNGLPMPVTTLLTKANVQSFAEQVSQPVVLKIPDGSFSQGVKRAGDQTEFADIARGMLKQSEIILVQEFIYTPFDWRIGVLDGEPLFAARYFMCDQHWQILKHGADGSHIEGRTQAVPVEDVPKEVREAALKACRLIGDGFYGVDLKETERGVFVIEINDNPNLDKGMEDRASGDAVYHALLQRFVTLFEQRSGRQVPEPDVPADPSPRPATAVASFFRNGIAAGVSAEGF